MSTTAALRSVTFQLHVSRCHTHKMALVAILCEVVSSERTENSFGSVNDDVDDVGDVDGVGDVDDVADNDDNVDIGADDEGKSDQDAHNDNQRTIAECVSR